MEDLGGYAQVTDIPPYTRSISIIFGKECSLMYYLIDSPLLIIQSSA
jgi:hypothetical protein